MHWTHSTTEIILTKLRQMVRWLAPIIRNEVSTFWVADNSAESSWPWNRTGFKPTKSASLVEGNTMLPRGGSSHLSSHLLTQTQVTSKSIVIRSSRFSCWSAAPVVMLMGAIDHCDILTIYTKALGTTVSIVAGMGNTPPQQVVSQYRIKKVVAPWVMLISSWKLLSPALYARLQAGKILVPKRSPLHRPWGFTLGQI